MFCNKRVVEVGAGCGITGMVASRFARLTVLTDGSDIVLKLMDQNVELEQEGVDTESPHQLVAHKLLWGEMDSWKEYSQLVNACDHGSRAADGSEASENHADIILGADVFCWPDLVVPLLLTVKALLAPAHKVYQTKKEKNLPGLSPPVFFCGFVCRATDTRVSKTDTHSSARYFYFVD
jgi:hypothetical protein